MLGIVRAQALGWTSTLVLTSIGTGIALLAAFVAWELRAQAPMLPMRFFRNRGFAATNGVSLAMFFGSFGSIFLLAQFFQVAQGYSPLEAGLRTLPWTAMPIFVAPIAGLLSDRIGLAAADGGGPGAPGGRPGLARRRDRAGRCLQRARARASSWRVPAWRSCSRRRPTRCSARCAHDEAGQASGATNAIREVGGVLGVAVLATVFAGAGGFVSPEQFVDGLVPAVWVGAAVLAVGALFALLIPGRPCPTQDEAGSSTTTGMTLEPARSR